MFKGLCWSRMTTAKKKIGKIDHFLFFFNFSFVIYLFLSGINPGLFSIYDQFFKALFLIEMTDCE